MRYLSTRGAATGQRFSDVLLEGLAPDGGLAIPEAYPFVDPRELARWRSLPYPELAFEVMRLFADDLPADALRAMVDRAYTAELFGSAEITPLRTLAPDLHILELSNGPTLAFKDIAMQFLGQAFEYALERAGTTMNILGATSGDTGSSAEHAMRGKQRLAVFMLSPHGKMSPFQAAQMYALQDANIYNLAVRGVFDECQDVVKAVNSDADFKSRYRLGAVNSINWARISAQIVYYFKGYFAATRSNEEQVSFAVPSGNFGNIYAGHVARSMGLPIRRLILATNENDVLDEFFRTGVYRVRKNEEVRQTSSPSMDISKASNFERYVSDLVGRDATQLAALWQQVETRGYFDLRDSTAFAAVATTGFVSGSSSHRDRIETIRSVYERYGTLIDTHTADGVKVGLANREPGIPLVCLETALPAKFAAAIREALGRDPERPKGYEALESLPQRFTLVDPDPVQIKAFIARHAHT
ncbi:MAG: threonine synthase [Betaproteobacteria bacterium]|nr:MAG: threonine synthase [Betaproteobacteria bacterium]